MGPFHISGICPDAPDQEVQFSQNGNSWTSIINIGCDLSFTNTLTCNPNGTTPETRWSGNISASCGSIILGEIITQPTMNKPGYRKFTWGDSGCKENLEECCGCQCEGPEVCCGPKGEEECCSGKCINEACCPENNVCGEACCNNGQICINGNCCNPCGNDCCEAGEQCINGKCCNNPCDDYCCEAGEQCINGNCCNNPCDDYCCEAGDACVDGICEPPGSTPEPPGSTPQP